MTQWPGMHESFACYSQSGHPNSRQGISFSEHWFKFVKSLPVMTYREGNIERYAPWTHEIQLEGVPTREKSTAYRRATEDDRGCQTSLLGKTSITENLKVWPHLRHLPLLDSQLLHTFIADLHHSVGKDWIWMAKPCDGTIVCIKTAA